MKLLVVLVLATACQSSPPSSPAPSATAAAPVADLPFVELHPHGATARSPLVIAFHGRGDTPENFAQIFDGFPVAAEILIPRGLRPFDDGFAWFISGRDVAYEDAIADVRKAVDTVMPAIEKRAAGRPIYVTGFSQGGILSFALARTYPQKIAHAFPVAGRLFPELEPKPGDPPPAPTDAFHGTADNVLSFADGQRAVESFKAAGARVTMHPHEGVAHQMMPMREDLFRAIVAALPH